MSEGGGPALFSLILSALCASVAYRRWAPRPGCVDRSGNAASRTDELR